MKNFIPIVLFSALFTACNSNDPYDLQAEATPLNEWSSDEKSNLEEMQKAWLDLGDKYQIVPTLPNMDVYNVHLEEVKYHVNDPLVNNDLIPVNAAWVKDQNFEHLGILNNAWSDCTIHPDLVYATKYNNSFFIFDKNGNELFTYNRIDTLENGQMWYYDADFCFVSPSQKIGCILIFRGKNPDKRDDFRIYDLEGSPICSWKKMPEVDPKFPIQRIDPYFGAIINRTEANDHVKIISFEGKELHDLKDYAIGGDLKLPYYGILRLFKSGVYPGPYLLNFEGNLKALNLDCNLKIEIFQ